VDKSQGGQAASAGWRLEFGWPRRIRAGKPLIHCRRAPPEHAAVKCTRCASGDR
jgi:hypothetical protein